MPPAAPPSSPAGAALTEADWRAAFDERSDTTLGVEEELMLLDPATLELLPEAARAVDSLGDRERFRTEMPAAQVEIVTPVARDAPSIAAELHAARHTLGSACEGWARLAGSGTHPTAPVVGPLSHGARYEAIRTEYGWAAERGLVFGLHVHVGVRGADRALAVFNALRSHLPEIAALAGNAPFQDGRDTGLASVRPKIAEGFPRQGVPPSIASWRALSELESWGRAGGAFPDATQLWWEARLHPRFGTIEVRVPDQQATVAESMAVVAFAASLVAWLAERHDAGERLASHDSVRIAENRWRALRHGLAGTLLDLDTGEPEGTRRRVRRLIECCAPAGERLGATPHLADADALARHNGAERQRALAAERGLEGLIERLADLFAAG